MILPDTQQILDKKKHWLNQKHRTAQQYLI